MNPIRAMVRFVWKMSPSSGGGGAGGNTGKLVFAVVGLVVAGILLVFVVPRLNRTTVPLSVSALGEITAEETAKMLNNNGSILVIAPDVGPNVGTPALEEQMTAFHQGLKKFSGITVAATETLGLDAASGAYQTITADVYRGYLQKYPNVDAIVSFIGPPQMSSRELRSLPQKLPKFLAISLAGTPLKPLFQAGMITEAIISRLQPHAGGRHSKVGP